MPYIECHIATGLTKARKTQLIRDIVKVTHESIGSDPKIINVLLFEHPADNMSISGRIHGEEAPKQAEGTSLNQVSRSARRSADCLNSIGCARYRPIVRRRCRWHRWNCVTTAHPPGFLKSVEGSR